MSILSVDFHTHILPGIDDGCPNGDEAVQMLRMEYEQGTKVIFLTPHFNGQEVYPDAFLAARQASYDGMLAEIKDRNLVPTLFLGAEVRYCPGMSTWEQLPQLALGDTDYILIEMPFSPWTDSVYDELERIYNEHRLVPVLAHIERYFLPFQKKKMLKRLSAMPVLLQMNTSYLLEKRTRASALKLLKEDMVHFIGSDCHSASWRTPNIGAAREILLAHPSDLERRKFAEVEKAVLLRTTEA